MGALAADAADARIVFSAKVALGGLAPAPADLRVEGRAVALANRRAALGPNAAVELATVLVARRCAAALGCLGAGTWTWLAPQGSLRRLRGLSAACRVALACHCRRYPFTGRTPAPLEHTVHGRRAAA